MTILTTRYPVVTLDGKELVPANTTITDDLLKQLIADGRTASGEFYPLVEHCSVKQDLIDSLAHTPYQTIFSQQIYLTEVLDLISDTHLCKPILQTLDYFKEKDYQTYRHSLMVFCLSVLLARMLFPDDKKLIIHSITGASHDIGKICVPIPVLQKKTPLTSEEYRQLKHHPIAGYILLTYYLQDKEIVATRLARDHHERMDGTGYPRGILQTDTMVEIVMVADVYDALIMPRPYRPQSYDNRTALEEITKMAEKGKIGWEVLKALIALNRKNKSDFRDISVSSEKRGTPPVNNVYGIIED